MRIIKQFNLFSNIFCRICGHLQWLKWAWKMDDAPFSIHNPNICKRCAPSYRQATNLFERMVDIHVEQQHTPLHLKPKFKPYLVGKK